MTLLYCWSSICFWFFCPSSRSYSMSFNIFSHFKRKEKIGFFKNIFFSYDGDWDWGRMSSYLSVWHCRMSQGVKIEYILDKATLNLFLWKLQMLIMQVKRRSRCEFVTYTALSSWWPISLLGFFEIMGKGLYLSYIVRKISFFICPYISILHPLHHN